LPPSLISFPALASVGLYCVDMTLEEFQKEFFKHAPAGRKPPLELMPVIKSSLRADQNPD